MGSSLSLNLVMVTVCEGEARFDSLTCMLGPRVKICEIEDVFFNGDSQSDMIRIINSSLLCILMESALKLINCVQ